MKLYTSKFVYIVIVGHQQEEGSLMNRNNKAISSLCYFSIFFAPFLLPLIVYFIVDDREVKHHAKASLFSHILPVIVIPLFIVAILLNSVAFLFFVIVLGGLASVFVLIWNIIKGVQLLKES